MLSWRENEARRRQERETTRVYLAPRMLACGEDEALTRAIDAVGWAESPSAAGASFVFNVCNPPVLKLQPGIIFSRFPAMQDCCRKALFAALLGRLRKLLPATAPLNDGLLIPQQWALPVQRAELKEYFDTTAAAAKAAGQPRPLYIVKPDSGCQGHGITVTAEPLKQSPYAREAVVQQYIANPMLLDGLKFDLRLYVLVTSVGGDADCGPMRAFICREGMVRLAVDAFDGADVQNVHAHVRCAHAARTTPRNLSRAALAAPRTPGHAALLPNQVHSHSHHCVHTPTPFATVCVCACGLS